MADLTAGINKKILFILISAACIFLIAGFLPKIRLFLISHGQEKPANQLDLGFPTFPVYPQAQLIHNEIVNDPTVENIEKRYLAVWNSNDQAPQISQWYQENIVQSGWTMSIPPADLTASIQQIEFQKEDTTLTVSIVRQKTVTEITLDYRPGPTIEANETEEEQ